MKKITIVTYALCMVATFYACKKENNQKPENTVVGEPVTIKVSLGGEISTSTAVLDARAQGDKIIYGVSVQDSTNADVAQGLFTNPDSIWLKLTTNVKYRIKIAAFKKGSGLGLYIRENNGLFVDYPLYKPLNNTMYYADNDVANYISYSYLDTLANMYIALPNNGAEYQGQPELDSYFGTTEFRPRDTSSLRISLKRLSFGVEYRVANLDGGQLEIYDFNGTPTVITTNGTQPVKIYTENIFKYRDTTAETIRLQFNYKKPGGTSKIIGYTDFLRVRNKKTIINITLPGTTTTTPVITMPETDWSNTGTINL